MTITKSSGLALATAAALALTAATLAAQPVGGIELHLPRYPIPSGTAGVSERGSMGMGGNDLTSVDVGENEFDVEVRANVGAFPLAVLDLNIWLPGHCTLATTPSAASASAIPGVEINGVRVGSGAYNGALADPYSAGALASHDRNFPGVLVRELANDFAGSVTVTPLGPTATTFVQTGFRIRINNVNGAVPRFSDLGGSFVVCRFRARIDTMPCNRAGMPITNRIRMNYSDIDAGVVSPDVIAAFQSPDPGSNFTSRLRWQQGGAAFGEVFQTAAFAPMTAAAPTVPGGTIGMVSNPANGLVEVTTATVFNAAPTAVAMTVRFAGGADAIITDLRSIANSVQNPASLPTLGHIRVAQSGDVWFEVERRIKRAAADLAIPTLTNPAADPGVFDQSGSGLNAYPNLFQYGAGAGGAPSSTAITDQFQVASYNFNSVILGDAHTSDIRNGTGFDGIAKDPPPTEIVSFTAHAFIDGNVITNQTVAGDFNDPTINTTAFDPDGSGAQMPLMPVEMGGYTVEIGYDNSYWSVPSTVNPGLDYDTTRDGIQITGASNSALRIDAGTGADAFTAPFNNGRTLLFADEGVGASVTTADPISIACGGADRAILAVPVLAIVPAGGVPTSPVTQIEVTLSFDGSVVDVFASSTGNPTTDDAGDASGLINDNDGNRCNDGAIHFRHGSVPPAGNYDAFAVQWADDQMSGGSADLVRIRFIDTTPGGLIANPATPNVPAAVPGTYLIGWVRFAYQGTTGGMAALGAGAVTGAGVAAGRYTSVCIDEVSSTRPVGIADFFAGRNSGFYVVDSGVQVGGFGPGAIIRNLRDGAASGIFDIHPLGALGLSVNTTTTMTWDTASVPAAPGPSSAGVMASAAVMDSSTGANVQTITWTPSTAGLSPQGSHTARFSFNAAYPGPIAGPLMSMDPAKDLLQVGTASVVDLTERFGFFEPQDPSANQHFLSNILHPNAMTTIRTAWVDRHDVAYNPAPPFGFHRAVQLSVDHGPGVLGTFGSAGSYDTDFNGSAALSMPGPTGAYQLIVTEFASSTVSVSPGMHHVNQPRRGNTQAALQRRTELFEFRLKTRGGATTSASPLNPGTDSNNPGDGAFVWGTVTNLKTPNSYPHVSSGAPVNVPPLNIQPGEQLNGTRNVGGAPSGGGGADADDTRLLSNTIVAYTNDFTAASSNTGPNDVNYVFETPYPPTVGADALAISVSLNDANAAGGTLSAGADATLGTRDDVIAGVSTATFIFDPAAPPIAGPLPATWPNGPYSLVNGNDGILSADPATDIRTGQFGRHSTGTSQNGGGLNSALPTARYFAFTNAMETGVALGSAQRNPDGTFGLLWRGAPSIGQGAAQRHDQLGMPQLSSYFFNPFTGTVSGSMMIPDNFADVLTFCVVPVSSFNTGLPHVAINIAVYENDILDGFNDESLFVDLVSVLAEGFDREVLVTWESGTEIDNAGYNIYRSTRQSGPWERINVSLIPGLMDSEIGGRYFFIDRTVTNDQTYYYGIEDVEISGLTTFHSEWITSATPEEGRGDAVVDPLDFVAGSSADPVGGGSAGGGGTTVGGPGGGSGAGLPASQVDENEDFAAGEDPYDQSRRSGFGGLINDADESGYTLTFNYPRPSVTPINLHGIPGHEVTLPGLDRNPEPGMPDVPVDRVVIDTLGKGIASIEIIRLVERVWPSPLVIFPVTNERSSFDLDLADLQLLNGSARRESTASGVRPIAAEEAEVVLEANRLVTRAPFATTDAYFTESILMPEAIVATGEQVNVRGTLYETIMLNPIRTVPQTGALRYVESVTFRIVLAERPVAAPETAAPDVLQSVIESGLPSGKPALTEEGIYRIEFARLATVLLPGHSGFPGGGGFTGGSGSATAPASGGGTRDGMGAVGGTSTSVDPFTVGFTPGTLGLFDDGQPLPMHVEDNGDGILGEGDNIVFYGQAQHRAGSKDNVIWVVGDVEGRAMRSLPAHPRGSSGDRTRSRATAHFEEDNLTLIGHTTSSDRFYWVAMVASPQWGIVSNRYEFPVEVPAVAPSSTPAVLKLELAGMSADEVISIDHHLQVFWNGDHLGDVGFDGHESITAELPITGAALQSGDNTLEIVMVGDTGPIDLVALLSFDIEYDRELDADGETSIAFSSPDLGVMSIRRLRAASAGDIIILDVTDPTDPIRMTGAQVTADPFAPALYNVRFDARAVLAAGAEPSARRYLIASEPKSVPVVLPNTPSHLLDPRAQADYIMIVPAAWQEALLPLAELRETEGMSVRMVTVEDIYDTFSYGDPDAESIKSFLQYAYASWARPAPAYVLLAGDGHYDPQDLLGTGNDSFVPVHMLQTFSIFAASDNYFAAVAGSDDQPDLSIGRLPARSADELANMVAKILTYEARPESPLTGLAAADASYYSQVQSAIGVFPGDMSVTSTAIATGAEVRQALMDAFAGSTSHIAFLGHGSITQWGQGAGVLNVADVANIEPGIGSIVSVYNCLSGYFQHPSLQGIGEELVRVESGGAVALLGPTAVTGSGANLIALERTLENAYAIGYRRIGDILAKVKLDLIGMTTYSDDFIRTWTLIGDPAMTVTR